jgi:hypothetical protein
VSEEIGGSVFGNSCTTRVRILWGSWLQCSANVRIELHSYPEDGGTRYLSNVGTLPPDCTVLYTEDHCKNIYCSENQNLKILTSWNIEIIYVGFEILTAIVMKLPSSGI